MESVEKLRECVESDCAYCGRQKDLLDIADRIDAEYGKVLHEAIRNALANGEKRGLRQAKSASEDYRRGCRDTFAGIADTHIALPVDEDGVPIRVGDELEPTSECGMRVTVNRIQFTDDGCWVFAGAIGRRPNKYRHAKPDSWEQIIEDVRSMDGCGSLGEFMERHGADFVARCKALAGEE